MQLGGSSLHAGAQVKRVFRRDGRMVPGSGRLRASTVAAATALAIAALSLELRRRLRVARAYPFFVDWVRFSRHIKAKKGTVLVHLGSDWAGYEVPDALPRDDWICYSGGVGEDASFDLELIQRYGCSVYAFDPTPRGCEAGLDASRREANFHFLPYGLWSEDARLKFYAPHDPSHDAYSIPNLQNSSSYVVGECRSLPSLMTELGHDRIDLLKLDIEGAEYAVLDSLREEGISVKVLLIVFHKPSSVRDMIRAAKRLQVAGYKPLHVEKTKVTFLGPKATPRRARAQQVRDAGTLVP